MIKAMFRKPNYMLLEMLIIILALTACEGRADLMKGSSPTVALDSIPITSPSPTPISSQMAAEENTAKEDDSIRAIGTHPDGRLLVRPASKASAAPLGAPSCIGMESDLQWSGDYEAVWESKSNETSRKVMTFPIDFEIVQQDETTVKMQEFTMGNTAIFAYVPRYTDCHGLETYFFGVSEGKAFPISLEMKPDQIWANISQLPHRPFQVANGELILTGGYGAGQDFIAVYHFRYDPKKHSMILQSTDQVNPNDINNPYAQQAIILDKDLDGDGKPEHLALTGTGYPESPFIFTVNNKVQQAITAISSYELKGAFSVVDLNVPDQNRQLTFPVRGPSGIEATLYFEYDSKTGDISEIGTVPGSGEQIRYTSDGKIITTSQRATVLSTWFHEQTYVWTKQGRFEPVKQDLYNANLQVTLKKPLDLFVSRSNRTISGTLKTIEKAVIEQSDDQKWFYIHGESGTKGWFEVRDFDFVINADTPAGELFDGLNNAG